MLRYDLYSILLRNEALIDQQLIEKERKLDYSINYRRYLITDRQKELFASLIVLLYTNKHI